MTGSPQWLRAATLVVSDQNGQGLDLSQLHFIFDVRLSDEQSPNTATIRVYNLSKDTVRRIRGEFSYVQLSAGYVDAQFGVVFAGTIIQYRIGKQGQTDTYLDILASDGDEAYNFGTISQTLAAGSTPQQRMEAIAAAMGTPLDTAALTSDATTFGGVLPRGKVLWGMGRGAMTTEAAAFGATWSIQGGRLQVIPKTGYLPGETLVITSATGMVGIPEQTDEGVKVTILLNPNVIVGGTVRIDNKSINQTAQALNPATGQPYSSDQAYNSYAPQLLADISADGLYRVYVSEHNGDSRGNAWYTTLTCLAIDPSTGQVNTGVD